MAILRVLFNAGDSQFGNKCGIQLTTQSPQRFDESDTGRSCNLGMAQGSVARLKADALERLWGLGLPAQAADSTRQSGQALHPLPSHFGFSFPEACEDIRIFGIS